MAIAAALGEEEDSRGMSRTPKRIAQNSGLVSAPAFEDHLRTCASRLQRSVLALLDQSGMDRSVPLRVAKGLGIDKSLAWKICRVAEVTDPAELARCVPGSAGLEIFISAVSDAGVGDEEIKEGRAAIDAFEEMVTIHAGDRASLRTMLNGNDPEAEERRQESLRKLAYQGQSAMVGVQVRVHLRLGFVVPNAEDGSLVDEVSIVSLVDVRRLRMGACWPIAARKKTRVDPAHEGSAVRMPLDDSVQGVPVVERFCSKPLPALTAIDTTEGTTAYVLEPGRVGNTGLVTCVLGLVTRGLPRGARLDGRAAMEHMLRLSTPAEIGVNDVFIHRDLMTSEPPRASALSTINGMLGMERGTLASLPLLSEVESLSGRRLPEYADYGALLAYVHERLGWDQASFVGYRIRMTYPPVPMALVLQHDFPD